MPGVVRLAALTVCLVGLVIALVAQNLAAAVLLAVFLLFTGFLILRARQRRLRIPRGERPSRG